MVEDASKFNVDDTVLLIQMKGAVIDTANSASFGTVTDYRNAGNYELNYVKSKTGNVIEFKNNTTRQYDLPLGRVQLIRVPFFQKLNVSTEITCLPWDGKQGGVLAFNVQDSLILNAPLDVSGKGLRGGRGINTSNNNWSCNSPNYYYQTGAIEGAEKGEGITEVASNKSNGKGPLANGGGGGNQSNAGGGGGGNASTGGKGGNQFSLCGTAVDNRGMEGKSITVVLQNRIFLGGGGGSGDANNPGFNSFSSVGGTGGGIIIVTAGKLISQTSNNLVANGANGLNCNTGNCHEGMAGGGAGGSILLQVNNFIGPSFNLSTNGGKGADATHTSAESPYEHGPGGGGSGGAIWIIQAALPSNVSVAANGGINGVNINFGNSSYGSTPGANGTTLFNLILPVDIVPFTPNIDSVRIKDSAINCNTFNFKGLGFVRTSALTQWQWTFGDGGTANTQNTAHSYLTPGTYNVKLVVTDFNGCKDSIMIPISITGASSDFAYKQNVCNPLSIQFNQLGNATSGNYWNFGDGNSVTGTINPTHVYTTTGNYLVKFGFQSGSCTDTVTKTISVNVVADNIILTPDTSICFGSTKQLRSVPSLNFCWSPTTYLDNPLSPNPVTSTPGPITYYLNAEVQGTNVITNGNFSAGNSGFTSDYNYAVNNITEGQYYVGPSPQAWNPAFSNCGDHTTGNGNMLLVNGSPAPDVNVWRQTVAVTPNTNYAFSSWIQALYPPNPAQLSFSINGSDIGNLITASLPTCTWSQFYTTWNSGNNTSALISIVNKNTLVQGNDFALDDISFAPVLIKKDSVKINVDTPVVRTIADTTACLNIGTTLTTTGAITYSWAPATWLNAGNIANPVATPASTTQYIVSGTNAFGCTAKDTVTVTVKALPAVTISNDDTICVNQSVALQATGGTSYSWTPAATLNNATISNPVASPTANTVYKVMVTGANSCTKTDSLKISVNQLPVFAVSPAVSTCVNGTAQLWASGGQTYVWSPSNTLSASNIANPVATVQGNSLYTVIISENICNIKDTLTTSVTTDRPLPLVKASKSNDMDCVFSSVQLTAAGAKTYSWSPAAGLSNSSIANPVATPSATQLYVVSGTDSANCKGSDTLTVFVKGAAAPKSYIPNSFTPNGDGMNDCFRVRDFGNVKSTEIIIYNRYGNLVFKTNNNADCWNGTYKGQAADAGNYVYYIKIKNDCGETIEKGNLLLIR